MRGREFQIHWTAAMSMRPYVVRQGDYLMLLAVRMGFDADTVWNDAKNSDLRAARPNHNILAPGDILYVPEHPPPGLALRPNTTNRYSAQVPTARIVFNLAPPAGDTGGGSGASPFANEAYIVEGLGDPRQGSADGNGQVALDVPIDIAEVHLRFDRLGLSVPVRVGHLDPISVPSGVRQRLSHLGHCAEDVGDALREFQRAHGLTESGELDDATRSALEQAHGA